MIKPKKFFSEIQEKKSGLIIIFTILGVLLTLALIFVISISNKNKEKQKDVMQSEDEYIEVNNMPEPEIIEIVPLSEEINVQRTSRVVSRGKNMNAVTLVPGKDFLLKPSNESVEDVYEQIDQTIKQAVDHGFNTVIVDLRYSNSMIYQTDNFSSVKKADFMSYIEQKSRENNLYIYALYEVFLTNNDGVISNLDVINDTSNQQAVAQLSSFVTGRALDGVILTGYDNPGNDKGYSDYITNGMSVGYENYLRQSTQSALKQVAETVHNIDPTLDVGIVVDSVWANASTNEHGIQGESSHQQLVDGNADTKKIIESGYADFVVVDDSSSDDVPFEAVIQWWGDVTVQRNIPLIMMHLDQDSSSIVDKIDKSKTVPNYMGTAFSSLTNLLETNEDDIDSIVQALGNNVPAAQKVPDEEEIIIADQDDEKPAEQKSQDEKSSSQASSKPEEKQKDPDTPLDRDLPDVPIAKELQITNLKELVFSTEEPIVVIRGSSDPNEKLYVNDKKIETDSSGYFSYDAILSVGKNTFVFKHKEKNITVEINKTVKILKEVTPVGNINLDGGSKLTITAIAYPDCTVTATLGSLKVNLEKQKSTDENVDKTSSYEKFIGEITIPDAKSEVQNLGEIQVVASLAGETETLKGATVSVNKKVKESAKTTESKGKLVQVTATLAETFPTDTINDISNSKYYPLPKGTIDHAVSEKITYTEGKKTFEYYNLSSGNRVYAKDITILEETSVKDNNVSGVSITNDGTYTYVSIANDWKVSHKMSISNGILNIKMMDTANVSTSLPTLTSNPLFSSAVWSEKTLQLKLAAGGIFGVTPYYNNNTLVFQFANPKSSSGGGTVVVIDPGHGGSDPGAPGFYPGLDERELNQAVAAKLQAKLQAKGVTALIVPPQSATSLQGRIDYAIANKADLFVSVHHNTSPNAQASGVEAYYFSNQSKSLASSVSAGVSNSTGFTNRGGKYSTYFVTRHQHFPSILVECGFMTNKEQYNKLIESATQDLIAQGIADGVVAYLNNSYISAPVGVERTETTPPATAPETSSKETSSSASTSSKSTESSQQSSDTGFEADWSNIPIP